MLDEGMRCNTAGLHWRPLAAILVQAMIFIERNEIDETAGKRFPREWPQTRVMLGIT